MSFFQLFDTDSERRVSHRRRVFKDRLYFVPDKDFQQRFRLSPNAVNFLEEKIGDKLRHSTRRNLALSPREQILTALRVLSTNGFYHLIRDAHGPSESTVCRVLRRFVTCINEELFDDVVRWPTTCLDFSQVFHEMHGIPSVCGLIDGALVRINPPREHEEQFVDRKGKHSLNVMLVSGPKCEFVYCNASWPGSVNDVRVLKNSNLFRSFEHENFRPFPGAILLGDSIYPCKDWLVPPVLGDNLDEATKRFNSAHKRTRSLVERSIGQLKARFPCLRWLRVRNPSYAAEIVKTCVTLHNICILIDGDLTLDPVLEEDTQEAVTVTPAEESRARRQSIIDLFR